MAQAKPKKLHERPESDETPPAGAFMTVGGRRWRTSDPHIPENLRQELVNELMAARRAIRDEKAEHEVRRIRSRVSDAKTALGERGHPWWLPAGPAQISRRIDAALRALLTSRGEQASICPSDVARVVGGSRWRLVLPEVRERAAAMAADGELVILRRGRVVDSRPLEGVLRYRLVGVAT